MKLPPNTVDAEKYLLGVLMRDALPLPERLKPSDFFEPKHQDIAYAITSLWAEGSLAQEDSVFLRLKKLNSPVEAYYISDCVSQVGYTLLNPAWEKGIKHTSQLRRLSEVARQVDALANDEHADPIAVATMGLQAIESVQSDKRENLPQKMLVEELMTFDRKADPANVIGNRWLTKGSSLLIVGQSGTGKSALMTTAAINWCIGRDFFGIKSVKPLRTICIQAENDLGDVAESLQDLVQGLFLNVREIQELKERLYIYREAVATGEAFGKLLRTLVKTHEADIVFIDPLLAFAGIDITDQKEASHFLRHILQPILNETGVILVAMHHTGKPRSKSDKEGQTIADLAYSGLGSSELTNYFREVAVLARCQGDAPIYKFGLTKRRSRSDLTDINGNWAGEIFIRHSPVRGVIKWERSLSPEQEGQASQPQSAKPTVKGSSVASNRGFGV
jgi:replicative DNA helicase